MITIFYYLATVSIFVILFTELTAEKTHKDIQNITPIHETVIGYKHN